MAFVKMGGGAGKKLQEVSGRVTLLATPGSGRPHTQAVIPCAGYSNIRWSATVSGGCRIIAPQTSTGSIATRTDAITGNTFTFEVENYYNTASFNTKVGYDISFTLIP